jgi:hypothetical protein
MAYWKKGFVQPVSKRSNGEQQQILIPLVPFYARVAISEKKPC